jgi:hypothetical protein
MRIVVLVVHLRWVVVVEGVEIAVGCLCSVLVADGPYVAFAGPVTGENYLRWMLPVQWVIN